MMLQLQNGSYIFWHTRSAVLNLWSVRGHLLGGSQARRSVTNTYRLITYFDMRGLGGVVVIDAALLPLAHAAAVRVPYTLPHRCSDLGQVVSLSLSVA